MSRISISLSPRAAAELDRRALGEWGERSRTISGIIERYAALCDLLGEARIAQLTDLSAEDRRRMAERLRHLP